MPVEFTFVLPSLFDNCDVSRMHGLPCSSLGHCFGHPSEVNSDPTPSQGSNLSRERGSDRGPGVTEPVISQPEVRPEQQRRQREVTFSCVSTYSTRSRKANGTNPNGHVQDGIDDDLCFGSPQGSVSSLQSLEDDDQELELSPELEPKYPQIPRPSIIIRQPKYPQESEFQETSSDRSDCRETQDGRLSGPKVVSCCPRCGKVRYQCMCRNPVKILTDSVHTTTTMKTADLTVVQKTLTDTLHTEGKSQKFIGKRIGCSQHTGGNLGIKDLAQGP
ncbi:uncharacterized protein LOC117514923 [Thalassophryne amazonica]|uniref:uncharacterized protein LOC117514923 n=1 Tax=Thalassophryne amazonica TaxID=390379 RepID=UPI001471C81F|nr:uncharacterized protein LOC117514923 [Thalassophryne amazonica]